MHTREITVVVEGQEGEALAGLEAMARRVQVVQASVNGTPVNFETLPNPPGSRFGEDELPEWPKTMSPAAHLKRYPNSELADLARRHIEAGA